MNCLSLHSAFPRACDLHIYNVYGCITTDWVCALSSRVLIAHIPYLLPIRYNRSKVRCRITSNRTSFLLSRCRPSSTNHDAFLFPFPFRVSPCAFLLNQSVKECHLVWVVVAVFRSFVVKAADPAFRLQR